MLDENEIKQLKYIFVTREECDKDMAKASEKQANSDQQIAVINTKLNYVLAILGTIGAAVVAAVVKYILGG